MRAFSTLGTPFSPVYKSDPCSLSDAIHSDSQDQLRALLKCSKLAPIGRPKQTKKNPEQACPPPLEQGGTSTPGFRRSVNKEVGCQNSWLLLPVLEKYWGSVDYRAEHPGATISCSTPFANNAQGGGVRKWPC